VHIGSMYLRELHANYINVNTLLVRRSLAGNALIFGEKLPTYEDWSVLPASLAWAFALISTSIPRCSVHTKVQD